MPLDKILSSYRAAFPNDPRTDDDLVIYLGSLGRAQGDRSLEQDPDFSQKFSELTQPSAATNFMRSLGRGAMGVVGEPLKSLAITGSAVDQALGIAGKFGLPPTVEESPVYKAGQAIEDIVPAPGENATGKFWQSSFPSGFGSTLSFFAGGALGKLAKLPELATIGLLGGGSQAPQGYEEAKAAGVSDAKAYASALLNFGVGTSEVIPLAGMLHRLDKFAGGAFKNALIHATKETFEETLQEAAQQAAQNLIARGIYDPKREIGEGVLPNAAAGGLTGFTFSTLTSAIGHALRPKGSKATEKEIQQYATVADHELRTGENVSDVLTEAQQKEVEEVKKRIEKAREESKQRLEQEQQNANPTGLNEANNQQQHQGDSGLLENQGVNRDEQAQDQEASSPPSSSDSAQLSGSVQAPPQEVVTETPPQPTVGDQVNQPPVPPQADASWPLRNMAMQQAAAALIPGNEYDIRTGLGRAVPATVREEMLNAERQRNILQAAENERQSFTEPPAVTTTPPGPTQAESEVVTNAEEGLKGNEGRQEELLTPQPEAAPTPVPQPPVSPPTPPIEEHHPLVDKILYDDTFLQAEEGKSRGKASDEMVWPAVVNLALDQGRGNFKELEQKATSQATARDPNARKTMTHRTSFFENQETGEIIGLPTYRAKGTTYVAAPPGEKSGVKLKDFLDRKMEVGNVLDKSHRDPLWAAMDSVRHDLLDAKDPSNTVVFSDANEYQRRLLQPAKDRLLAARRTAAASQEAMQAQYHDEEGNVVETAGQAAEEDPYVAFNEMLWDYLPRDKNRKVFSDLSQRDIDNVLLNAMSDPANQGAIKAQMADLISLIRESHPEWLKKTPQELKPLLIKALAKQVYENYKQFVAQGQGVAPSSTEQTIPRQPLPGPGVTSPSSPVIPPGGPGTRFSRANSYTNPNDAHGRFFNLIQRLTDAGADVQLFQARINALVGDFFGEPGSGAYDAGNNTVSLILGDLTQPNGSELLTAMHETVHFLFAQESPEMKEKIHQAVDALGLSAPGAAVAEGLSPAERARRFTEEGLANTLSKTGFNRMQSRSMAAQIWRFLKDLYYRTAMAVQESLFGAGNSNPRLAIDYMQNRLARFQNGDLTMRSFLSWLGGGIPNRTEQAAFFYPTNGNGWFQMFFNPTTGGVEYPEPLHMNSEAVRYYKPQKVSDPITTLSPDQDNEVVAKGDIAAQNERMQMAQDMYQTWTNDGKNTSKVSFDEWLATGNFVKFEEDPRSIIGQIQQSYDLNQGASGGARVPISNGSVIGDLPSEYSKQVSYNKAYKFLLLMKNALTDRMQEAKALLAPVRGLSIPERMSRNTVRLTNLIAKFQDAEFMFDDFRGRTLEMVQDLKADISDIANKARKVGILKQVITQLEGAMTESASKAYLQTINKLFTRLTGERRSFSNLMLKVADMGYDWQNTPTDLLRNFLIEKVLGPDPQYAPILKDPKESKALVSIIIAFAKENEHAMALLQMGRTDAGGMLHEAVQALRGSISATKQDVNQVVKRFDRVPRFQKALYQALAKIESIKEQNHSLLDEMKREKDFVEFYDATRHVLNKRLVGIEKALGVVELAWEATDGSTYWVPPHPAAEMSEVRAKENQRVLDYTKAADGSGPLRADLAKMEAWLQAVPEDERGAEYQTVRVMKDKLGSLDADFRHRTISKSWTVSLLGSITDKLDMTGIPQLRNAATRIREYGGVRQAKGPKGKELGIKWDRAMHEARKLIAPKMATEVFTDLFHDKALKFLENNSYLLAAAPNFETAMNRALPQLRNYLESDPDTRALLGKPGSWEALERFYRLTGVNADFLEGVRKETKNKVKETAEGGGKSLEYFRESIGEAPFTLARGRKPILDLLYQLMRPKWLAVKDHTEPLTKQSVAAAYAENPDALRTEMADRFVPKVWQNFVRPLVYRVGRAVFNAPATLDGLFPLARREDVIKAFHMARGDIVAFAENLYALSNGKSDIAQFVGETLETFQNFFNQIHADQSNTSDAADRLKANPRRTLIDARVSEEWPQEWLSYNTYGQTDMNWMINDLAYQHGYGRDMVGMRSDLASGIETLRKLVTEYREKRDLIQKLNPNQSQRWIENAVKKEFGKDKYLRVTTAQHNLLTAQQMQGQWEAMIKSQHGLNVELKPWVELLSALTSFALTGPKTAFNDTNALFESPLRKMGVSSVALKMQKQHIKSFGTEALGSLFQALHLNLWQKSAYAKRRMEAGYYDSDSGVTLKDRIISSLSQPTTASGPVKGLLYASRVAKALLQSGAGGGGPFTSFKLIHSPFVQESEWAHFATIDGIWTTYEELLGRASEKFLDPSYAVQRSDPNFQFGPTELGYQNKFLGILKDEQAFGSLKALLQRYGMNLETMARAAAKKREAGHVGPLLDHDALRLLASAASNEFTGDSNITNRPPSSFTNPVMALAIPLLGWTIWKSSGLPGILRLPTGETSWKAFRAGLMTFAAILPVGLAYALLRDEYDEKLLNKKSNVVDFGEGNALLALVDRAGVSGIFGAYGDALNSAVNMSTQRPFTVDTRVFFVSSLINLVNSAGAWARQDKATYATVYRNLLQSIGGAGFLQYAEIINNIASLDNEEARVTARINVANYLRAAGRSLDLEVLKPSYGGSDVPSPIRPYVSDMVLAAYANDGSDFQEAYQAALAKAKEMGKDKPEDYVKRSYATHHPLKSVFRSLPTDQDYLRILDTLTPRGAADVTQAVGLFNHYGNEIGLKDFEGREEKDHPSKFEQELHARLRISTAGMNARLSATTGLYR